MQAGSRGTDNHRSHIRTHSHMVRSSIPIKEATKTELDSAFVPPWRPDISRQRPDIARPDYDSLDQSPYECTRLDDFVQEGMSVLAAHDTLQHASRLVDRLLLSRK
jgi:hypothetical protein